MIMPKTGRVDLRVSERATSHQAHDLIRLRYAEYTSIDRLRGPRSCFPGVQ